MNEALLAVQEVRKELGADIPHRSLFERYRPDSAWFAMPSGTSIYHGEGHATRVLVLSEITTILQQKQTPDFIVDQEAVRWAAVLHDSQRHSDDDDIFHGMRASRFAAKLLQGQIPLKTLLKVMKMCDEHVPDDTVESITNFPELALLKDPDAVDRARSGDLDVNFLRLPVSRKLVLPGELFFQRSSHFELSGRESFNCVMDAAVELGLIQSK